MKYKVLGKSITTVPAIGQGCMGIGGYLAKDTSGDIIQIRAIKLGIDLGMTFLDTAESYGNGHSEELVGVSTKGIRDKVFIATKVSPDHLSYDSLLKSTEASLNRLKTDYIDLYQVHWPNPQIPINETMRGMEQLLKEGKIRYVGLSNFSFEGLKQAQTVIPKHHIVSIQMEYNLFDRTVEDDLLPYCQAEEINLIAYSPIDQGEIAHGKKRIEKLKRIANKYGVTTSQIALNWLVSHELVVAIPRSTTPKHIRENATSTDFDLLPEDIREIDDCFQPNVKLVPPQKIRAVSGGIGKRATYLTVEEAIENRLGFVPSPVELADDILKEGLLKPVRVTPTPHQQTEFDYDLVEGGIRYWAWVIAYDGEKCVPVLVRDS